MSRTCILSYRRALPPSANGAVKSSSITLTTSRDSSAHGSNVYTVPHLFVERQTPHGSGSDDFILHTVADWVPSGHEAGPSRSAFMHAVVVGQLRRARRRHRRNASGPRSVSLNN